MNLPADPLLDHLVEVVTPEPAAGPWQMAADEALLRSRSTAVLRFYHWDGPQITFGFFGNWDSVVARFPGVRLTRRWTGGGVVEHGEDLTWSICLPASHPLAELRGARIYRILHETLARAMREVGENASLAQTTTQGDLCFQNPVPHDLLDDQGKVAGGALRRARQGTLYQGSIRFPSRRQEELRRHLRENLASHLEQSTLTATEVAEIHRLERERYSNPLWLRERIDPRSGQP